MYALLCDVLENHVDIHVEPLQRPHHLLVTLHDHLLVVMKMSAYDPVTVRHTNIHSSSKPLSVGFKDKGCCQSENYSLLYV